MLSASTIKSAGVILAVLVFAAILLVVSVGIANLEENSRNSSLQMVRAAVEQAVMQSYALEGAYPPDLDYPKTHYGLIVDDSRYAFLYEVIGDNVHPIIDVQLLEDVQQ